MWEFLERLIKMALPVVRDFRGVSPTAFDGNGNYTLGITDQSIFPEIEIDKIKRQLGFDICIVTTATTDDARTRTPARPRHAVPRPQASRRLPERSGRCLILANFLSLKHHGRPDRPHL